MYGPGDQTAKTLKEYYQEISKFYGRVSSQVVNDREECALCSGKKGIGSSIKNVCYLRILIECT